MQGVKVHFAGTFPEPVRLQLPWAAVARDGLVPTRSALAAGPGQSIPARADFRRSAVLVVALFTDAGVGLKPVLGALRAPRGTACVSRCGSILPGLRERRADVTASPALVIEVPRLLCEGADVLAADHEEPQQLRAGAPWRVSCAAQGPFAWRYPSRPQVFRGMRLALTD